MNRRSDREAGIFQAAYGVLLEDPPRALDWEELHDPAVRPQAPIHHARQWRRGVIIGIAAALFVLLVVGGGASLVLQLDRDEPPVIDQVPTTVPVSTTVPPLPTTVPPPPPSTSVPPTTTPSPSVGAAQTWVLPSSGVGLFQSGVLFELGPGAVRDIIATDHGLLAVGPVDCGGDIFECHGTVWSSPDGSAWTEVFRDADAGTVPKAMAIGNEGFVAVGDLWACDDDELCTGAAWTSPDGETWTRVANPGLVTDSAFVADVVAGGPGYIAVGQSCPGPCSATIWTSEDGHAWTRTWFYQSTGNSHLESVTSTAYGYFATGTREHEELINDAALWTSLDGVTWSLASTDTAVFGTPNAHPYRNPGVWTVKALTEGGPGLVAVGNEANSEMPERARAAVWISPDGQRWERVPHDPEAFDQAILRDITATPHGLVAVGKLGEKPAVWTSPYGIQWTPIPNEESVFGSTGTITTVTVIGDTLFMAGSRNSQATIWAVTLSP